MWVVTFLILYAHVSRNIFDLICTYLRMWVVTYLHIFAHICACESQHIWSCKKCKKPWMSVHWKFQERRMGHGKSRPLRNLSKKKGFRLFHLLFCAVSRLFINIFFLKGGKCMSGSFCWKSLCVVSVCSCTPKILHSSAAYFLYGSDIHIPGLCCFCNPWAVGWCCYLYGPWGEFLHLQEQMQSE